MALVSPRFLVACSLLAAGLLAAPPAALATWPHDHAAGVPICTRSGSQQGYLAVVPDDEGGAIAIWQDRRAGTFDLYAQRIDAEGHPQWTRDGVLVNNFAGDQSEVSAIPDGEHGVILSWRDARFGPTDIYAQRLDASGVRVWTTSGVVVCSATGDQLGPRIVADGLGGVIIAWTDYRNSATYGDIYAQRLNSSGTTLWRAQGAVVCSLTTTTQNNPCIASDMAGGAIIAWSDYRSGTHYDVYAQRMLAGGTPSWTTNGVAVVSTSGDQYNSDIAPDGDGGAYVAWTDTRSATSNDIYAQRISGSGTPMWDTNGIAVCTATLNQLDVQVAGEGHDGVFVAWNDARNGASNEDIYAQHLHEEGTASWADNGRAVCTAAQHQFLNKIVGDGLGGLILMWDDSRFSMEARDLYAQRLNAAGSPQWDSNGLCLAAAPDMQVSARPVADGTGGAIVFYVDYFSDHEYGDIYAKYVERFGHLGDPAPAIARVADVPNDQGGFVQVEWTASYLDTFPGLSVARYSVWRRVPNPAPALVAGFARAGGGPARSADGRTLRTGAQGAQAVYWEQVATQAARALPGYSLVTTTTSDSLPGSNPCTAFMVMAEEEGGTPFWMSAADSGYSVDNMAPPMPSPFTGHYLNGSTRLDWGESAAPDLAGYRLHRGDDASFVPDLANLISAQPTTGYNDWYGVPCFYKLCAVDIHGNISPYALLTPAGTTDAPGAAPPRELALSPPAPNPLRGSATLTLALPREAQVSLAVYDQQGRRVRVLAAGTHPAGEHAIVWDGRDDDGRVAPGGIYFVRCVVEGRTFTRRIAAIR